MNYKKVLLGYNNEEPIYLSPPSWDCGKYWGFGYLENKTEFKLEYNQISTIYWKKYHNENK